MAVVVTHSSLVFECSSKACAPPPVGVGGSNDSGGGGGGGRSSGAGSSSGGGSASAKSPRIGKGKRVTVKDDDGTSIGTVRRDSKGRLTYEGKSGIGGGTARNYAEAKMGLKAVAKLAKDRAHAESPTGRKEAAAANKAAISDRNKLVALYVSERSPAQVRQAVKISKDNRVRVAGKDTEYRINTVVSRGKTRYSVTEKGSKVGGSVGKKSSIHGVIARDLVKKYQAGG